MLFVIIGAAVLLLLLYLFCLAPNTGRREQMAPFEQVYIAHRGLFDNDAPWPENSLPAFRRAVEAGYGIELDVQLTKDHQMVVFHDGDLSRMCGAEGTIFQHTYEELCQYTLAASDERIPLFRDVLEVIGGKVPLIVEVKQEGDWKETTKTLRDMMADYPGLYCMESFHPLAVAWYRKNCPDIPRGQLSTNFRRDGSDLPWWERFVLTNLLLNFRARPDFIAYDHKYAGQLSYWLCRHLFPVENVAWTIKSQEELAKARKSFQVFIFDGFIP
ncbi:MAG: glycerophosphodiester phosphodiesterase [Oscillospiraceae bacterium]|nr:glycerophosphodiester phosphodiesterase [Oscillospiraceae bacterium]